MKRCQPFFHDWEVLETIEDFQLRDEGGIPRRFASWRYAYDKKICLKCGHIIDEISKAREKIRNERIRADYKREKALKLLKKVDAWKS